MNLISFKNKGVEMIAPNQDLLIGPHYGNRKPARLPPNEKQDPFPNGLARYATWPHQASETDLKGTLTGKNTLKDLPLSQLEGQNFTYDFHAHLEEDALHIKLACVSDTDSLVGGHFSFRLPSGVASLQTLVRDKYLVDHKLIPIPPQWGFDGHQTLKYSLNQPADYTFLPAAPRQASIQLHTSEYSLTLNYSSPCQENSWQLIREEGSDHVSIAPLSSFDPLAPNLTVSQLMISLKPEKVA